MTTVWILYIIANLGPAFTFEHSKVIGVYSTEYACRKIVIETKLSEEYMRLKCEMEIVK